ncbi:SAV_2336 N-terminal domain-related protein [Streptomyces sp. NPDC001809]
MEELLDVLWLAATTRENSPAPELGAAARPHTPAVAESAPAGDARGDDDGTAEPDRVLPDRPTDKAPRALHAPGGGRGRRLPASSVALRGVRAIPAARGLHRALRPLRRPTKSRTSFVVDETATADLIADTALPDSILPDVVMRPEHERWLDAVLVVDDGPSMVLWRQYATETRALLENQGLFHRVRTYGLDSSDPNRPILRSRPFAPTSARASARRLADPVRPTVVLVLSDGVGPGWAGGAIPALLERWARHSPVAVVQPLPERLWPAPVMPAEQWLVTAARPAAPGRALLARHPVLPPGLVTHEGPAIPVFELEESRLAAWTRLLLGGGGGAGELLHLLAPAAPSAPADSRAGGQAPDVDTVRVASAEERLRAFRQSASPESRRLAGALASVWPLTLPVMRLVHQAEQPGPGSFHPAQLAEVFLGGLLHRRDGGPTGRGEERADCAEYEFLPGVAELLLDTVRTSHAVDTATRVSDFLMRRWGTGPEFRARLSGGGGSVVAPGGGAFAAASPELLRRLGLAAEPPQVEEREPEPEEVEGEPLEDDVSIAHVWPRIAAFVRRLQEDGTTPGIVPLTAGLLEPWLDHSDPGSMVVGAFGPVARVLLETGQHDAVAEFRGLLRDCVEPFLPDESLAARTVRGHTAIALSALGETAEAVEHLHAVISISARVHGAEHGYTLNARAYLHELYEDAEWLVEGAAEGRGLIEALQRLPRNAVMPSLADVQMVQGRIHHELGEYAEAEQAIRAAYDDYTSQHGAEHDTVLYARGWLATTLLRQGRVVEAEEEARAVLGICERLPGDEGAFPLHAGGRFTALGVLEDVYQQAGRYPELLTVRKALMDLLEQGEGGRSHGAIRAQRVWAGALRRVGDFDEALKAAEDAADRAGRLLGENHIESLLTRELVAIVLADRKEFQEAERRQRAILDQGRRVLGEDHANCLDFRHNLGTTLLHAERFDEAEAVLRYATDDHVRVLGYRHANTRSVQRSHAVALVGMQRPEEAEAVLRRLLDGELGLEQPPTLSISGTRVALGKVLGRTGRHDEAVEQFSLAWQTRRGLLGADAPKTLSAALLLGSDLVKLGRYEEARDLLEMVVRSRERVLGTENRATLWSRMWFGDALEGLGRSEDAAAHWGAVREVAAQLWGETDRIAMAARRSLDRVGLGPDPDAEAELAAQE